MRVLQSYLFLKKKEKLWRYKIFSTFSGEVRNVGFSAFCIWNKYWISSTLFLRKMGINFLLLLFWGGRRSYSSFLKKTDCFLHNEWRKPQVRLNIRKLWKIICTNDEPFSNTAWLGQKYEAILRDLGFNRTSWQIVRVGTSMHIHALNFQEWCKKSVLMLLDRQGHSGKGLMLVSFCRLSNREVSGKESQLRKWSH